MVRGSGRGISPRLIATGLAVLLVAACSSSPVLEVAPPATSTRTSTSTAPSSTSPSTTTVPTTTLPVTTSNPASPSGFVALLDIGLEIRVPEGEGPFPTAVLVHGGGWVAGAPALMGDLARFLAGAGYLIVNSPYTLSNGIAGFPIAVDDIACAVRYAAAHPDGDGTVAVIGHSAGAHLAALVALDDGHYGADSPVAEPVIPDRLIGLAGPYDVTRLGPLMLPFFGVGPDEDAEVWVAGNPLRQAANNPGLSSLIMHGGEDALLDPSFAFDFAEALDAAGSEALVELVEGARHNDMHDPEIVGDLIVTWLQRA